MKFVELDEYPARVGTLREWRLCPLESGVPDATPPSYNQEWHFRGIDNFRSRGVHTPAWLAISFEIGGELDGTAFRAALSAWMVRHETLRSGFHMVDGRLSRFTVRASAVRVTDEVLAEPTTAPEVVQWLEQRLDVGADGANWPNHVVETIEHAGGTTVVVAFDHSNVDGYSLLSSAHELRDLYVTALRGGVLDQEEVCSYLDYCRAERESTDNVDRTHPAVVEWERFVSDAGGDLPEFPLDTGVSGREMVPQTLHRQELLDAPAVNAVEALCRQDRSSVLAAWFAASAIATHELCGQSAYRTVSPFHTRTRPEWAKSMGWYIGAGPVEISVDGAADFRDLLPKAQQAVRRAVRISRTPFVKVCKILGLDAHQQSADMFSFLSYIDMRDIPGVEHWDDWDARAVLRVTRSDDKVGMWGNRTHEGIQVVARHPDTPQARTNVPLFVERVRGVLRTVAATGSYPLRHRVP